MKKIYNPQDIETKLYEFWEQKGCFKPNNDLSKKSFCIMISPPNVTGNLHIGHAFQQTIMDIMIRYHRMQGKNTFWQVGTDHAGIATQMVVESKISSEEGKTRNDYTREEFISKIWKWKEESGSAISHQMRRLGYSVDWERERFTMDEGISNAVKEVFVRLYKEKLIYRGKRLINWDPKLRTAISDLEVEQRESTSSMWYIRYPLADGNKTLDGKNYLVVMTTRPETLLGDTGVAVNPKDLRYQEMIGKFILVPLVNRRIPIVGDEYVDMKKGTGCVKITPAHDFNDYKIAQRHDLPMINILTFDGSIRENAEIFDSNGNNSDAYKSIIPKKFQKLDRFAARKEIVASIKNLNLLEEIRPHNLCIPYSDRGGVIIEPMLTDQWYVRTDVLAKPAVEAVENGSIQFIPKEYKNMFFSWMREIQDWCISRQLWWGHRIPAWYDKEGHVYVGRNISEVRQENNLANNIVLQQDEDVLDTWFSSALWTFSTLGWPENTEDLHQFQPTNVIVSGFDIIFFWIARMIMMTMHFIKDENDKPKVPFYTVYITGLIRDENGQKMSKSKGNVIDPVDIIDGISLKELLEKRTGNMMQPKNSEKIQKYTKKQFPNGIKSYGTDALRFSLAAMATSNREITWNMTRIENYRSFCNKLWNASRFVLMNAEGEDCGFSSGEKIFSLADRWILSKHNQTVKAYRKALDNFRFDIAVNILYEFTWNHFCDWYLECTKSLMKYASEAELRGTRHTLISILESLLRLSHPIIPFITESIWQRIKIIAGINAETIMLQPFPEYNVSQIDKESIVDFEWVKKVIVAIRNIRSKMNIAQRKPIKLLLRSCNEITLHRVKKNTSFLQTMAHLVDITVLPNNEKVPISVSKIIDGTELLIPMTNLINKESELERLSKEITKVEVEIKKIKRLLETEVFLTQAPKKIINQEKDRLFAFIDAKSKLIEQKELVGDL